MTPSESKRGKAHYKQVRCSPGMSYVAVAHTVLGLQHDVDENLDLEAVSMIDCGMETWRCAGDRASGACCRAGGHVIHGNGHGWPGRSSVCQCSKRRQPTHAQRPQHLCVGAPQLLRHRSFLTSRYLW
jgi:hypothetical protein